MTAIDPKVCEWASNYQESLEVHDHHLRHSVVVVPKRGSWMWIDSAFIIRVNGCVCIFSPDTIYIYRPDDLFVCREVIEVESQSYDSFSDIPSLN